MIHVASVAVAGTLTRESGRALHDYIWRSVSRTHPLPPEMLEDEVDQVMVAVRDAVMGSTHVVPHDACPWNVPHFHARTETAR